MALEITVTAASEPGDRSHGYKAYNVRIGNHRILAVLTDSPATVSKWLKSVLKSPPNTRHGGDTTVVGISAARDHDEFFGRATEGSPFQILCLSVGSHCLLFELPSPYNCHSKNPAKYLSAFFQNPNVVAVAADARRLAETLHKVHEIKIESLLDARDDVAVNGLRWRRQRNGGGAVDVRGLSLDQVAAAAVGGPHVAAAERPESEKMIKMYAHSMSYYCRNKVPMVVSNERIKFSTLDSYLCFLVASEFVDAIRAGICRPRSSPKKKNNKNKKKKKNKPKENEAEEAVKLDNHEEDGETVISGAVKMEDDSGDGDEISEAKEEEQEEEEEVVIVYHDIEEGDWMIV